MEGSRLAHRRPAGGIDSLVPPKIPPLLLFLAFSEMALSGFGGVLPFASRHLVERRRWLSPEDFTKLVAASQVGRGGRSRRAGWLLLRRPAIADHGTEIDHRPGGASARLWKIV